MSATDSRNARLARLQAMALRARKVAQARQLAETLCEVTRLDAMQARMREMADEAQACLGGPITRGALTSSLAMGQVLASQSRVCADQSRAAHEAVERARQATADLNRREQMMQERATEAQGRVAEARQDAQDRALADLPRR